MLFLLAQPKLEDLPSILDKPIQSPEDTGQEYIDGYDAQFIGAYESTFGANFNIYAATQPGQESALEQNFKVNPQGLEYILEQISLHIPNAPTNSAKESITKNLRDLKQKDTERIIDMIIDVSPVAGCLDTESQLVAYLQSVCEAAGAQHDINDSNPVKKLILVGTGVNHAEIIEERLRQLAENKNAKETETGSLSPHDADQQATIAHEIVHAVSDIEHKKLNSFSEGDDDHEITRWLIGKNDPGTFDFKGAKAPSPDIGGKIRRLVKAKALPPILSVAGDKK